VTLTCRWRWKWLTRRRRARTRTSVVIWDVKVVFCSRSDIDISSSCLRFASSSPPHHTHTHTRWTLFDVIFGSDLFLYAFFIHTLVYRVRCRQLINYVPLDIYDTQHAYCTNLFETEPDVTANLATTTCRTSRGNNYINYIQKLTGRQTVELLQLIWHRIVSVTTGLEVSCDGLCWPTEK